MRGHSLAVQASVSPSAAPQAAVVGIVVTDDFEVFFDTLNVTRKVRNRRRNPTIAFVLGGLAPGDKRPVQYEGVADESVGTALQRLKSCTSSDFPTAVSGRVGKTWSTCVPDRRGSAMAI